MHFFLNLSWSNKSVKTKEIFMNHSVIFWPKILNLFRNVFERKYRSFFLSIDHRQLFFFAINAIFATSWCFHCIFQSTLSLYNFYAIICRLISAPSLLLDYSSIRVKLKTNLIQTTINALSLHHFFVHIRSIYEIAPFSDFDM